MLFTEAQRLSYIPFTESEFDEIITSFSKLYFKLDDQIIHMLGVLCGRHPGLTRASLSRISNDFKKGETFTDDSELSSLLFLYIVNGTLAEKLIFDCRCFLSVDDMSNELQVDLNDTYSFISMLLNKEKNYYGTSFLIYLIF